MDFASDKVFSELLGSTHKHTVLWVVGEPGIGKTTLCRKLLDRFGPVVFALDKPKWTVFGPPKGILGSIAHIEPHQVAAAVGSWKGDKFDGGDTVPPSYIKQALETYAKFFTEYKLVLFDGAKFANGNAIQAVMKGAQEAGRFLDTRLVCLHLVGPEAAAAGRAARVDAGAKPQNEAWIRGRRKAADNFTLQACFANNVEIFRLYR